MSHASRAFTLVAASSLTTLIGLVPAGPASGQTVTTSGIQIRAASVAPAQAKATAPAAAQPGELPPNVFEGQAQEPAVATAAADPEAAKKAARLAKIRQLTFNRRPSAILRAWANPAGEEEKKPANPAPAATAVATPDPANPGAAATTTAAEPDPFDEELKALQRSVTLGDWPAVKAALGKLAEEESKAAYKRLLDTLPATVAVNRAVVMDGEQPVMAVNPQMQQFAEKNAISTADVIAIAGIAPQPLEDEQFAALGRLLGAAIDRGHAIEDFQARVRDEIKKPAAESVLGPRQAAKVLMAANRAVEAGEFLPGADKAVADNDREALNLLSRHYLARYAKEKKVAELENAWKVTQSVLAAGEVDKKQKDEALKRAVELAPKIHKELGQAWLEQSFTERPERGMEIIATIGSAASQGITAQPQDPDGRLKALQLQKTAVEALLKAAPERADQWRPTLALLAAAWLGEADFSYRFDRSTSLGPMLRRDVYGNFFYLNEDGMMQPGMPQNQNMPRAIAVAQVLDARPEGEWLARLDDSARPRYANLLAQLYLKVGEETLAFPYLESIAAAHPDKARELAEEFLRIWARNHDPNDQRNRTNPYMFMFGFERKAESIPLTRSKQERNLAELAAYVDRLRKLPVGDLDETLLAKAFTACHSSAEVYRLEAFERVFGSLDGLKPKTLAELIQQMRGNLAGVWRQPALQEQSKTKRREKDIRAEVLRGYEVARAVVARALKERPDEWSLALAGAAVLHDENDYLQEIDPTSDFARRRREALAQFRHAADLYAARVPALSEDEETTQVYDQWFAAALGACDLNKIDEKKLAVAGQPELIRGAIAALPGEAAERHLAKFANTLFTRMSALNPAVKFRYLKAGFEIVGDKKQAHEAKKVYDYYKDLVTEIKLDAELDGADVVGEGPFGLFVNLRHTKEIERESGGFGRYLQNQNTGGATFFYNFGRPLENYRDKFETAAREALKEQFDVLSVTFQDEKVNSKASPEYGWRVTPYAYVLLKAKGPKVDKIPPLRLDLDFLDTSGYVILPVETPALPVVASAPQAGPRPYENLQVTQTLDERQAKDGKLIVEVKATARGLVPDLGAILDVASPGFEVAKTDDQGLSVAKFDPESEKTAVTSERTWLVTLGAKPGEAKPPETFAFAEPKVDAEVTRQRYVDADLEEVGPSIALNETYGKPARAWVPWAVLGLVAVAGLALLVALTRNRRGQVATVERFPLPAEITPFTVLGLLRDIQANNGLTEPGKRELAGQIQTLERHYFAQPGVAEPDLRGIAERWARGAV